MKAVLEFNLPEEKDDFEVASHANDWYVVVWELDNKLRGYLKYGHAYTTADEAFEIIRNFLHECLQDNNLTLDL